LSATAAAKGTALGLVGFVARLEERWLMEELGEGAYGNYRRRVPMLLAFGLRAATRRDPRRSPQ
jgi:protein-S-isoprenylcysteine O-methyltransferase Ste14